MASGVRVMEKPVLLQQQQQQQQQQSHEALKCPRCDSSNTKFCYYNNYSLSQPRHFCKSCKRYWTRGGTLRNVPVGGGCRKNKRAKKPITTTSVHVTTTPTSVNRQLTNPNPNTNLDHNPISSSATTNGNSNHHLNPLFYGLLPQNPNYPRFDTRVNSSLNAISGYDLVQPHMTASGLGFTSTGETGSLVANHCHNSGLSFSSYMNSSIYGGGSSSSSTSAPTIASLLASSHNQPQRFMGFGAYDGGSVLKDLKMEDTQNRIMEWNTNTFQDQNNNDQTQAVVSSDPNSLLWDTEGGGWLDPTNNIGSSVPSMI